MAEAGIKKYGQDSRTGEKPIEHLHAMPGQIAATKGTLPYDCATVPAHGICEE